MKGKSILLAALLVCSVLTAGVAMTGSALAQEETDTPTDDGPLAEDTLAVDEDTQSVQALAENSTAVLDVTIYGVDADGNETQVDTGTLDATANTTATYEYSDLDPENYDQYRVVVEGDGADTVEVNKVQVVSGGGGLWGASGLSMTGILGVVLLLGGITAAAIYTGRY